MQHLQVYINSRYPKGFTPDLYIRDGQHLSDISLVMDMLCNVGGFGASPLPLIDRYVALDP